MCRSDWLAFARSACLVIWSICLVISRQALAKTSSSALGARASTLAGWDQCCQIHAAVPVAGLLERVVCVLEVVVAETQAALVLAVALVTRP